MKNSDQGKNTAQESEHIPRLSFWQAMPKRHLFRIVFLLAALIGIVYLQQKTSAISGCMSEAFHAPLPSKENRMSTYKMRVEITTRDASTP